MAEVPRRSAGLSALSVLRAAAVLGILGMLVFSGPLSALYTDSLWFAELGRSSTFQTILASRLTLFFGFGLVWFVIVYANCRLADHLADTGAPATYEERAPASRNPQLDESLKRFLPFAGRAKQVLYTLVAGFTALIAGSAALEQWKNWLPYRHHARFGATDPVFGNDISFYVFRLPFLEFLSGWLLALALVSLACVVLIYTGERVVEAMRGGRTLRADAGHRHVLVLLGAAALAWCWITVQGRYTLLTADNGTYVGPGYTDLHARIPAIHLQAAALFLTALLSFANIRFGRPYRLPVIGIVIWFAAGVLGRGVWPGMVQRFTVIPNQLNLERPNVERDIASTRTAYGLDKVKVQTMDATAPLTKADITRHAGSLENIRLWDWPEIGAFYQAKQQLKNYYRFRPLDSDLDSAHEFNIDVDRYQINGRLQQVMLGAREIYPAGLDQSAKTWQNQRLQYTHGYGVVMSPVNRVDPEGGPEYLLSQIPQQAASADLMPKRPQIYYGELTDDYVFTGTRQMEFDHPTGSGAKETRYEGLGGHKVDTALKRLAWAVRLGDQNMLLSSELTPDSRLLYRRDVRERVEAVAPYLTTDSDPYLTVADGHLVWILDGYTTTSRYPGSRQNFLGRGQKAEVVNYVRNSVKATVDAYDGTVSLYASDPADPILQTWMRIFPGTVLPMTQMPPALRTHIRYPEDMMLLQRRMYTLYHMTDARSFYSKEDEWALAIDPNEEGSGSSAMQPYYVVMRLPGSDRDEFVLMSPFTPAATKNLSAWLCARCDPENYGELVAFQFPRGVNVNGPEQIMAQVRGNEEISRYQTLLDQRGSKLSYGNLLVIPVEKSILYAVPVYLTGSGGAQIPRLLQVIVAGGDHIAMRPTLEAALAAVVDGNRSAASPTEGGAVPSQGGAIPTTPGDSTPRALLNRATKAYQNARRRQREYDDALNELGRALEALQKTTAP